MNLVHYLLFKNLNWFEFNLALKVGNFYFERFQLDCFKCKKKDKSDLKDYSCGSKFNGALACKTHAEGLIKKKNMFV